MENQDQDFIWYNPNKRSVLRMMHATYYGVEHNGSKPGGVSLVFDTPQHAQAFFEALRFSGSKTAPNPFYLNRSAFRCVLSGALKSPEALCVDPEDSCIVHIESFSKGVRASVQGALKQLFDETIEWPPGLQNGVPYQEKERDKRKRENNRLAI